MGESRAKIIALAGKGGVGKTSLAASIVRVLTEDPPGLQDPGHRRGPRRRPLHGAGHQGHLLAGRHPPRRHQERRGRPPPRGH